MNTLLINLLILFNSSFYPGGNGEMKVEISGIKPYNGNIYIALYSDSSTFMNPEKAYKKANVAVSSGNVAVTIDKVENGEYAIAVLHDTNGNQELDFHSNGIPKEGYAFSNEARGKKGPPFFEDAKFTFNGSNTVKIKMINSIFNKGRVKEN